MPYDQEHQQHWSPYFGTESGFGREPLLPPAREEARAAGRAKEKAPAAESRRAGGRARTDTGSTNGR